MAATESFEVVSFMKEEKKKCSEASFNQSNRFIRQNHLK